MGAVIAGERSIASVVHDVMGNLSRIVRAEVRLAKVEGAEEVAVAARATAEAAKLLIAGAAMAQLALGFLFLVGMRGLEAMMAPWLAALVVGVATAAGALWLLSAGLKQLKRVTLLSSTARETSTEAAR
jgi:hypothetical protein